MKDDLIRWAVRTSPSRHLGRYLANYYRKNVNPEWRWVDCSIAGISFRIKVNLGEVHGYLCYMFGVLEPELTFFVRHLLPSKHFFLDIGANVGYYTVLAATVNPDCRIQSFEPSPSTFGILCENVNVNNLSNVQTNQLALGEKVGTLQFNIYADQALNSPNAGDEDQHPFFKEGPTQVIDVSCVKLDDFLTENHLPKPDVVKLDVEGFEYSVLRGAENLLASDMPPILLCEVQPLWLKRFGLVSSDLINYVEQFGYQTFGITLDGLVRKDALDQYQSTADFIFAPNDRLAEIMELNDLYYSNWLRVKGEIIKILRPIWRRMMS